MVKITRYEFLESTYATLWYAIAKTGDVDLLAVWKEHVRKEETPVMHYTLDKEILFGILDDLYVAKGSDFNINAVLHSCHKSGYYAKHYTF